MRPILLTWRSVTIPSYPALLYLGLVFGLVAQNWVANRAGLPAGRIYLATLLLFVPALAGARLLFVASHWPIYRREPRRIWRRSEGGAALYGGVPLSLVASMPLLLALELPYGAFWDVATVPILLGALFTKVGCLLNGCCGGRSTTGRLGLALPDHRGMVRRRVPTQLLEAGWVVILLVGVALLWNRRPFAGALYVFVLGGYGLGRLFLESTREEQDRVGRMSLQHLIAAITVLACAATLWLLWPTQ